MDRRLNSRKFNGLDPEQWTELGTRDIADGGDIGGYMFVNMLRRSGAVWLAHFHCCSTMKHVSPPTRR